MAKSIANTIDFAAKRQVWQRMIHRIIRSMLIAMNIWHSSHAAVLKPQNGLAKHFFVFRYQIVIMSVHQHDRQDREVIGMDPTREEWIHSRDALIREITALGFPAELGDAIAKHLGSPRSIGRMTAYLQYVQPKRAEEIVDEMLAIRSELDAWREKQESRQASAAVNTMLRYGLGQDE